MVRLVLFLWIAAYCRGVDRPYVGYECLYTLRIGSINSEFFPSIVSKRVVASLLTPDSLIRR